MSKTSVHVIPLLKEKNNFYWLPTPTLGDSLRPFSWCLRPSVNGPHQLSWSFTAPGRLTNTTLYSLLSVSPMLPCSPLLLQDDGLPLSR